MVTVIVTAYLFVIEGVLVVTVTMPCGTGLADAKWGRDVPLD